MGYNNKSSGRHVPMKKIIFIAFISVWLSFLSGADPAAAAPGQGKAGPQAALPFYSISQVNTKTMPAGTFETEGYVINIYQCPPCPPDAVCQPCPPLFIIISEKNRRIEYPDQMTARELFVLTDQGPDLKTGKKYRFKIQVKSYQIGNSRHKDLALLEFTALKK